MCLSAWTAVRWERLRSNSRLRRSVDEADEVRPAPVEIAARPHLADAEEVVVVGVVEVDHAQAPPGRSALVVAVGDLDAVTQQVVLLPVGGYDGLRRHRRGEPAHRVVVRLVRQAGVQRRQPLTQRAGQHDVAFRCPAQEAARSEVLVVARVHRFPAELLFQIVGGGLLDEGVLGIGGGSHRRRLAFGSR